MQNMQILLAVTIYARKIVAIIPVWTALKPFPLFYIIISNHSTS